MTSQSQEKVDEQLAKELLPLINNPGLLKGAVLMSYATQTDVSNPEHLERSESFAFHIVCTLIRNILRIDITDEQIIGSTIGGEAIGAVTVASLELAEQGYLIEESVWSDGCPYLRVRDKLQESDLQDGIETCGICKNDSIGACQEC